MGRLIASWFVALAVVFAGGSWCRIARAGDERLRSIEELLPRELPKGYRRAPLAADEGDRPFAALAKNPQVSADRRFVEGLLPLLRSDAVVAEQVTRALFVAYRRGETAGRDIGVVGLAFASVDAASAAAERLRASPEVDSRRLFAGGGLVALAWGDPDADAAALDALAAHLASTLGDRAAATWDVHLLAIADGKLIKTIKLVREITGLGLRDTKDLVESAPVLVKGGLSSEEADALVRRLAEEAGATAEKRPSADGAAPAPAPAAPGDGAQDVVLTAANDRKIDVIKAVRAITGLGLADAKALVERAPVTVKGALSAEEAKKAKAMLEAAGASVRLEPSR